MRFSRIAELFKYEPGERFSMHEIGCGLGHFKEYLDRAGYPCDYSGSDIIPDFIENDRQKFPGSAFFVQSISDDYESITGMIKGKDYYCLNGTFHTKEDNSVGEWERFVLKSMRNMFQMARKGICVNFLTSYSDFYDDKLYYCDPGGILDWSVKHLSRFVSIAHDMPLYEYCVYIYKNEFMKERYAGYEKYFRGIK